MAAGRGHLQTVLWFYENSVPGDISKAIDEANEGGHAEVRGRLIMFQFFTFEQHLFFEPVMKFWTWWIFGGDQSCCF